MAQGEFATSISCMDGRIQIPLAKWIQENHAVDYVDAITEPGVDRIIAEDANLDSIKAKVEISINAHKSKLIAVSGHHDCAGNLVSDEQHISQIRQSVKIIESWGLGVQVIGLWIDESWNVSVL